MAGVVRLLQPGPQRAGWAWAVVALCAAVFCVDQTSSGVSYWARLVSGPGNTIFLLATALILVWDHLKARRWGAVVRTFAPLAVVTLFAYALKGTVGMLLPRPSGGVGGFPSAHAVSAFAFAYLLSIRVPRLRGVGFGFAALIAWSRVQLGTHYPYQVAAGAIIGIVVPAIFMRMFGQPADEPERSDLETTSA